MPKAEAEAVPKAEAEAMLKAEAEAMPQAEAETMPKAEAEAMPKVVPAAVAMLSKQERAPRIQVAVSVPPPGSQQSRHAHLHGSTTSVRQVVLMLDPPTLGPAATLLPLL